MAEATKLYTADEFWEEFGGTKGVELVRGVVVKTGMTPTSTGHMFIAGWLTHVLYAYVEQHDLGNVTTAEGGFILSDDPTSVRAPDIGFIAKARLENTTPERFFSGPPDLAVEIVSPSDRAGDIQTKITDYLTAGTRLIWVVYPDTRTVVVHYPDGTARSFTEADTLDGGDVLPGFSLPVAEVFKKLPND